MHNPRSLILGAVSWLMLLSPVFSAGQIPAAANKNQPDYRRPRVDRDAYIGDYQGAIRGSDGDQSSVVGQVIALGGDAYKFVLHSAFDQRVAPIAVLAGTSADRVLPRYVFAAR